MNFQFTIRLSCWSNAIRCRELLFSRAVATALNRAGLAAALISQNVPFDFIGSGVDSPNLHDHPRVNYLSFRDQRANAGLVQKVSRILLYYWHLFTYTATTHSKIFHILWNNKLLLFDRTLLMLYYKLLGKKIILTAHNVNAGKRDGPDYGVQPCIAQDPVLPC